MRDIKKEKVLFLENINQKAVDMFKEAGFENIEVLPSAISEEELLERISDVAVLGVRSRTWIKPNVLEQAKNLVAMGCFIVGVNKVDLNFAEQRGVPVFHGPFSSTRSVAELTMGFVISLFRKIHEKNLGAHEGKWLKKVDGMEVRGKTLGIVGFSNIGSQVGLLAEAMGMRVIFYDVANVLPLGNVERKATLDELYAEADVVTVHVPSLPSTRGMINKQTINKMKDGVMLINTSRGDIFNEEDIAEGLKSGKVGGVAIDVYQKEPKSPIEPLETCLKDFPNALLTPHIGGSTAEAQEGIATEVAGKLLDYLKNGKTADSINFPKLFLAPKEQSHRVLHIHENTPGMLAKINETFASHNINIASQYLNTSRQIGYVVTDIEADFNDELQEQLGSIPHTVRCHVIC
ncbi:MAG: phosphoglycerate dehydrogenase [Candidatus Gracilibacteria bacterium]|jgi:D-3-phosphoglycerate dehydrogenase|nr:phosphoglycerate dehydrogenase [Candidatus Gracilibacteria bacterium]